MVAATCPVESLRAHRDTSPTVVVQIGAIPIRLQPSDPEFCKLLEDRYAGFLNPLANARYRFEIQLDPLG